MRTTSKLVTLGLSVVVTSALVAGQAGAETATAAADSFGARAHAEAMTISIAGTQLTGSAAAAELAHDPKSAAQVTELLIPGVAESGTLEAVADVSNPAGQLVQPETCLLDELEAIPGVHRIDLVCPLAEARLDSLLPYARGLGAELVLEPSVSGVLDTLGLTEQVQAGTDQVFADVVGPIVEALTGTPLEEIVDPAVATVQDVLGDALTLQSTARIVVAPALAEVTSTADTVTAFAHSQGIRIELLPVDEVGATNGLLPEDLEVGEPLITITVGEAKAKSAYSRKSGERLAPESSASAVTITFGSNALTEALGVPQTIEVPVATEQCLLTGTPLETCVSVASAGTDADGNPYATSTSISLFRGLEGGGIDLATGGVTSGSDGSLATPALPAQVEPPSEGLPRTGGPAALPFVGAGLLSAAVVLRRFLLGR
jgi:hypothetical protein